jgi:hypothetical protein
MKWPFKKKPVKKTKSQEEIEEALERNCKAAEDLKKTLERLGPMKDAADLLGGS